MTQKTFPEIFKELAVIDCTGKVEKKNGLTYLSWAWAWAEVATRFDAKYEIRYFDGKPYHFDDNLGYLVITEVTIDGHTRMMQLPVMDGSNKAQKWKAYTYKTKTWERTVEPATMFDINTAIMRCLTKNLAMFGLGHYIYAGEDLPPTVSADGTIEQYDESKPTPCSKSQIDTITKMIVDLDWEENKEVNIDKLLLSVNKNKLSELSEWQAKSLIVKLNEKLKLKEIQE